MKPFENPGVDDGILKKDGEFVVFVKAREQNETKQVGTCKTLKEAQEMYATSNLGENGVLSGPGPLVYELREVKEMKLFIVRE